MRLGLAPCNACRPVFYRINDRGRRITTLCGAGHVVTSRSTGPRSGFAGSAFEASLSRLQPTP
jgi:hypothetical protein